MTTNTNEVTPADAGLEYADPLHIDFMSLMELFNGLAEVNDAYPDALRLPRRAAFLAQIRQGQADSDGLWKPTKE